MKPLCGKPSVWDKDIGDKFVLYYKLRITNVFIHTL